MTARDWLQIATFPDGVYRPFQVSRRRGPHWWSAKSSHASSGNPSSVRSAQDSSSHCTGTPSSSYISLGIVIEKHVGHCCWSRDRRRRVHSLAVGKRWIHMPSVPKMVGAARTLRSVAQRCVSDDRLLRVSTLGDRRLIAGLRTVILVEHVVAAHRVGCKDCAHPAADERDGVDAKATGSRSRGVAW